MESTKEEIMHALAVYPWPSKSINELRRRTIATVAYLLILIVISGCGESRYDNLKKGMDAKQVQQLLGAPENVVSEGEIDALRYDDGDTMWILYLRDTVLIGWEKIWPVDGRLRVRQFGTIPPEAGDLEANSEP